MKEIAKLESELMDETVKAAREGSVTAMRGLLRLVDSRDDAIAFKAAKAVLDRAWGKSASIHVVVPAIPEDGVPPVVKGKVK